MASSLGEIHYTGSEQCRWLKYQDQDILIMPEVVENEPSDLNHKTMSVAEENAWNQSISLLLSKPILALNSVLSKCR